MKKTDQNCGNCKHFAGGLPTDFEEGYCQKHKEATTNSSWCATWKKPATKKAETNDDLANHHIR